MSQSCLKLPFSFDIEKLQQAVELVQEDEWMEHPNQRIVEGKWWVTSYSSLTGDARFVVPAANRDYFETPLLERSPFIREILQTFQAKIEAVRLLKLDSGSKILEHQDETASVQDGFIRLHIPILSNDQVKLTVNSQVVSLELGQCYYLNSGLPNRLENLGHTPRVTLMIDCQINDWMTRVLERAGYTLKPEKYGVKGVDDKNVEEIIARFKEMNTKTSLKMAADLEAVRAKSDG